MHKQVTEKQLKSFGLLMGSVLIVVTGFMFYKVALGFAVITLVFAVGFVATALSAPFWLKDVYLGWMKFAQILGAFNTKLILGLFYVFIFTPLHGYFLLTNKDPLKRKFDPDLPTYWEDRSPADNDPTKYEKQY
jgi:hypothetical protein